MACTADEETFYKYPYPTSPLPKCEDGKITKYSWDDKTAGGWTLFVFGIIFILSGIKHIPIKCDAPAPTDHSRAANPCETDCKRCLFYYIVPLCFICVGFVMIFVWSNKDDTVQSLVPPPCWVNKIDDPDIITVVKTEGGIQPLLCKCKDTCVLNVDRGPALSNITPCYNSKDKKFDTPPVCNLLLTERVSEKSGS